jgi:hypothetical protein
MKTSQEKVLNALSGLIPENAQAQVAEAVKAMLDEAVLELEAQYDANLEQAYEEVNAKLAEAEAVAEKGYAEAYEIILDQRDRIETLKEEYEAQLEEGYEEAFQMLQDSRSKNDTLEVDLYEEYDNRLGEIKEYIVDKVDQFLALKGEEFFENAKRDVQNDPAVAEHKVALDKILEVAASYLDADDYQFATSSKLDDLHRSLEETKGQLKILEARNMRLHTENTKLNEVARQAQEVLTEGARIERTARKNAARVAQSKGQRVVDDVRVIAEHTNAAGEPVADEGHSNPRNKLFQEWRALAGYGDNK